MTLQITLVAAAACAILSIWLALRIVPQRLGKKVLHGDGGDAILGRRMRAQSNFVEYAPFTLALIGLIELARGPSWPLWVLALVFVVARILHPFGMDGDKQSALRGIGAMATWIVLALLAGWAVLIAYQAGVRSTPTVVEVPLTRG